MKKPNNFLKEYRRAEAILKGGSVDKCYDIIFQEADKLFRKQQFTDIDNAFLEIDINKSPIKALVALFTITFHVQQNLLNRLRAWQQLEIRVKKDYPDLLSRVHRIF